ncbi:MAG: ERAP1-like C-terminal domain-containing protein [Gemmatimonadetes bacterium]|nr:ERAP1-like C-terminal domain-containing protein [Gemmatimonadota bacterium]
MTPRYRLPLVAGLLAAVAGCGDAHPPGLELGVSRALADARSATLADVAYDVTLAIPADRSAPIEGTTRISFMWDDPERQALVIDFKDPADRVAAVTVAGESVEWEPVDDHVVIPAGVLQSGANEVRVDFTAGDEALNRSDEFLYTLFVPDRAHFSLPVFDQPDLKARVSWELTVPEGWVAVANGPAVEAPPVPTELAGEGLDPAAVGEHEGPRTYRFDASAPIPTYLMAFAAGRFQVEREVVDGRAYHMYHRETDAERLAANRDEIFGLVGRSMAWMEDYTGIEHPFAKHDFVLVPSFQYGGMEHPGAVLYRAESLLLDPSATQARRMGRASLIAHETAHMWFGDLVTMKWFDDVWTKEVFANFMAAKIVQPSFPEVDHDLRFLLAHHPAAYAVDRTVGANAIRQPLENLREAGTLYGPIIYQKAPIVMRQLEARVGEAVMQAGLRTYLERFAYGNATWPDLVEILDGPTPDDLVAWSRVWVDEPGRPTVSLSMEAGEQGQPRPTVRQSDPWERDRVWPQRLRLLEMRALVSRIEASMDLTEPEQAFPRWAAGGPIRWVLPNGSGLEYGRFVLDDASLGALIEDLPRLENPLLRGSGWLVVIDALLEGQVAPDAVLDGLVAALETEDVEQLVALLVEQAGTVYWSFLPPADRDERAASIEALLWSGLERVDPTSAKATWFQGWRRVVSTAEGVARMRALWDGSEVIPGLPLSEADRTALAEALAVRGVDDAEAILDAQESAIENPDRLARLRFVRPALSADPEVRASFFESLADLEMRAREPWVLDALAHLNHPSRQDEARPFLRPGLDLVDEIQRTGDIFFPARWLGALLGGHQTPEAADIVVSFLADNPDLAPRLRGKVLQAADGVVRAAHIAYGRGPDLPEPPSAAPRP